MWLNEYSFNRLRVALEPHDKRRRITKQPPVDSNGSAPGLTGGFPFCGRRSPAASGSPKAARASTVAGALRLHRVRVIPVRDRGRPFPRQPRGAEYGWRTTEPARVKASRGEESRIARPARSPELLTLTASRRPKKPRKGQRQSALTVHGTRAAAATTFPQYQAEFPQLDPALTLAAGELLTVTNSPRPPRFPKLSTATGSLSLANCARPLQLYAKPLILNSLPGGGPLQITPGASFLPLTERYPGSQKTAKSRDLLRHAGSPGGARDSRDAVV